MPSEFLHLDLRPCDLIRSVAWCLGLVVLGLAVWRALESRSRARVPWSICLALGAACAVPIIAIGAICGHAALAAWLLPLAGTAGLLIGIKVRGLPRFGPSSRAGTDRVVLLLAMTAALGWLAGVPLLSKPHVSYDILSYHLPLAHDVAGEAGLGISPGNFYSRLPQAASLLYVPLLSDRRTTLDDPGVRVIIWFSVVAGSLLCGRLAGQLGGRARARWAAAALYAWHPIVWAGELNAHSDLLTAMLGLAAFERLLSAAAPWRPRRSLLLASGFLAGSAVAVKFSALGIVAVPLLLVAILGATGTMARPNWKRAGAVGLLVATGVLAALGLWLVRATVLGGHPLHPFQGEAAGWSADQAAFVVEQHSPRSPFTSAYWGATFSRATVFGYALPFLPVSALLIIALTGGVAKGRGSRLLLLSIGAGYGAWLLVGLNPDRFLLPVVGLSVAVAARWIFSEGWGPLRVAAGGALGLLLVGTMIESRPIAVVRSTDIWDREKILPSAMLLTAWEQSDRGGLLLLFEARSRLFPPESDSSTVWDVPSWAEDLKSSDDAQAFALRLRSRGMGSLFVNEFEFSRLLDFYGELEGAPALGKIGLRSLPQDVDRALAAYPSFRFGGLDDRDLRVLRDFLVLCRRQAIRRIPAGPVSEIWIAPIPDVQDGAGELN